MTRELKHLRKDPNLNEALLVRVLRRAADEHVNYVEIQTGPFGYVGPDGDTEPVVSMADRYRRALASAARLSGVAARLLVNVSRTAADVRARLRTSFALTARYPDIWVGVHLSGQEDQARHSLEELRSLYGSLRHRFPGVGVTVHAGEGFGEPYWVVPALAVGARRIGHGLNLIREPDAVGRMLREGVAGVVADPADLGQLGGSGGVVAGKLHRGLLALAANHDVETRSQKVDDVE